MDLFCPKKTEGGEKSSSLVTGEELLWKRAAGRADAAHAANVIIISSSTLGIHFVYSKEKGNRKRKFILLKRKP